MLRSAGGVERRVGRSCYGTRAQARKTRVGRGYARRRPLHAKHVQASSSASSASSASAMGSSSAGFDSARELSLAGFWVMFEFVGDTERAWCTGGEVAWGMLRRRGAIISVSGYA